MSLTLRPVVDLEKYPLNKSHFRETCHSVLGKKGVLVLPHFLTNEACEAIRQEGEARQHLAYYCTQEHNIRICKNDVLWTFGMNAVRGLWWFVQVPVLQCLFPARMFHNPRKTPCHDISYG